MKSMLPVLLLALAAPLRAQAASADDHAADRAQIEQLVERFKNAIRTKDGQALHGMFLPGASWLMGLDQASLAGLRRRQPQAKQFMPDDYRKFFKYVSDAPKPMEEIFEDVRIQTDGIVGTVYFGYRFLIDGKTTNHGTETWQLVHADDGWKISAMLYSAIVDGARP